MDYDEVWSLYVEALCDFGFSGGEWPPDDVEVEYFVLDQLNVDPEDEDQVERHRALMAKFKTHICNVLEDTLQNAKRPKVD